MRTWSIALVVTAGCSAFDAGDRDEAATMFYDTTAIYLATPHTTQATPTRCTGGGTYTIEGDDTNAQLSLDKCGDSGGEQTTTAPIAVTFSVDATDTEVVRFEGTFDYHLEGVSVGTDGTCNLALTITATSKPDPTEPNSFIYQWLSSGTICDEPVSYGCELSPGEDCFYESAG